MTFHYKVEYAKRSGFVERSERLNIYMHKLHSLALTKKIAVVITNPTANYRGVWIRGSRESLGC